MPCSALQPCLLSLLGQVNDCLPLLTAGKTNKQNPRFAMNNFTFKAVSYGHNSPRFHFYCVNNWSNVLMFKPALFLLGFGGFFKFLNMAYI